MKRKTANLLILGIVSAFIAGNMAIPVSVPVSSQQSLFEMVGADFELNYISYISWLVSAFCISAAFWQMATNGGKNDAEGSYTEVEQDERREK